MNKNNVVDLICSPGGGGALIYESDVPAPTRFRNQGPIGDKSSVK